MAGAIGVRLSRASAASAGILACATPERWLQAACEQWHELLIDHAYCEKKAASSAVALIFAYPECEQQSLSLARLAREELRHFEQVTRLMRQLAVPFRRLKPGRYAGRLRTALRTHEPARRVDLMLAGALIEARSCERFALLSSRLPAPLGEFYGELARVEARHGDLYLRFAADASAADPDGSAWRTRLAVLAALEAELISGEDDELRFHSGPPRASVSSS
jgi:tRNA 2-(methylsulfanyl)-N6-isopentenyladenosine37 hydroxylase